MPAVQLADGELNYLLEGPAGKPVLVLSNSLGTDLHMWDNQIAAFTGHFQVLRYDTRGHGKSVVSEGTYSIEQNGRDVLVLLDALSIDKAFFCGLSMGGLIGQWLAINASERLQRVVLCNTAAKIGNPDIWNPRIDTVLRDGQAAMVALRDASVARWFTPAFALAEPDRVDTVVGMLARTSPQGYASNCA
ncbi:alpha/beta fold hydrolase, partial [Pseudomonas syringae]|uniref:alpha/beta fold hydrolase n=1 Tax=Pseudomonas syringae TaxID=317 RepID=UPI000C9CD550